MGCVLDLDRNGELAGVELLSPAALAQAKGLRFDGRETATNAQLPTSYDPVVDAMYIRVSGERSTDQRPAAATIFISASGRALQIAITDEQAQKSVPLGSQ